MSQVRAPMVGMVAEVLVAVGDAVAVDDELVVIESMKMQIPVTAALAGTVTALYVEPGRAVQEGDPLLDLDG